MTEEIIQNQDEMPLLYKSVAPIYSTVHGKWGFEESEDFSFIRQSDSILITSEEFSMAQRDYAIVFSLKDEGLPFIVTGVPGLGNCYVDEKGKWKKNCYVPAFVRRYPFMLAKIKKETDELTLCFDEATDLVKKDATQSFFDQDKPTETTNNILGFCEKFEAALQKSSRFMKELIELDLLIESNAHARLPDQETVVLDGFRIISEEKLKELSGEQYQRLVKSGALGLIYAHLFSLKNIEKIFEEQDLTPDMLAQNKMVL